MMQLGKDHCPGTPSSSLAYEKTILYFAELELGVPGGNPK